MSKTELKKALIVNDGNKKRWLHVIRCLKDGNVKKWNDEAGTVKDGNEKARHDLKEMNKKEWEHNNWGYEIKSNDKTNDRKRNGRDGGWEIWSENNGECV